MRQPGPTDRVLLAVGFGVVVGVIGWDVPAAVSVVACLAAWRARAERTAAVVLVVAVVLGVGAAWAGEWRSPGGGAVEEGPVAGELVLRSDPRAGRFAPAALARWRDTPVLATGAALAGRSAGEVLAVVGVADGTPMTHRGDRVQGRVRVDDVLGVRTLPWFIPANAVRDRVRSAVEPHAGGGGALVSGFLIGDISGLGEPDHARLTAVGLSHFVAVSGSNVALFLALWWVVTLPLAIRPRTRWLTGVVGLALFVLITRWEPSVLRAATMAGLVLVGRAVGVPLTGWSALGLAVGGLALVDPSIVHEVGFQLSAAATLGLLAGAGAFDGVGPRWVVAPFAASVAAQAAVAPLLLAHFGSVPIVSPIANLFAAPLVAVSTSTGGIGALLGVPALVGLAVWLAELVLTIARLADGFPALGWWGSGVALVVVVLVAVRRWRRVGAVVAVASTVALVMGATVPHGPSLVALDVGQGDAVLLTGVAGARILVDGGPDPRALAERLRVHGVDRLDVVVISHRHADHVTGLDAVWGHLEVGEVWHVADPALAPVLDRVRAEGIPLRTPSPGEWYRVGGIELEVLGPVRRYVSPNDASLVVVAHVNGVAVGLVGDIETWAQADLGPIDVDVLKVPHQGAATSDPEWLAASAGSVAVISVGPNGFGHPAEWVVEVLEEAGAVVCRTDTEGDVVVPLAPPIRVACDG